LPSEGWIVADVVASGPVSEALVALQTLIANSTAFQTWTSTNNATDAAKHVIIGAMGFNVASTKIVSNVATIKTHEPHCLVSGGLVLLEGLGSPYDGAHTVATVPDSRTFTFIYTTFDLDETEVDDGIVYQAQRPFVVLQESEDEPLRVQTIGAGSASVVGGAIDLFLDADVSSTNQDDPRNAKVEMLNAYGNFVNALRAGSGSGDYMLLNEIRAVVAPSFVRKSEGKNNRIRFETWEAALRVSWGVEP
jgi:hypothetical protein